ncbi:MAG TPA: hypothetical protein VGK39_00405 [Cyclobacteriaceae bacterium]
MKQNTFIILLLFVILFIPITVFAKWPDKEKIKTGIIGSWDFNRFWGVYQNPAVKAGENPADINLMFTFYADGKARVWSKDKSKYNVADKKYHWGIVSIKSTEGKEAFAVKLVDTSVDPSDQSAIENAKAEMLFVMTGVSKKNMWWIKTAEDGSFSEKDYMTEFNKANIIAPTY